MTLQARLGIAPIAWWNDDLPELSDDVSLEECLRQARKAGFEVVAFARAGAALRALEEGGFDLGPYPAIGAWIGRVASQPGHIKITA